jgi:hypothetical protein
MMKLQVKSSIDQYITYVTSLKRDRENQKAKLEKILNERSITDSEYNKNYVLSFDIVPKKKERGQLSFLQISQYFPIGELEIISNNYNSKSNGNKINKNDLAKLSSELEKINNKLYSTDASVNITNDDITLLNEIVGLFIIFYSWDESSKAFDELHGVEGHKKTFSTDDWWFYDYEQLGYVKSSIDIYEVLEEFKNKTNIRAEEDQGSNEDVTLGANEDVTQNANESADESDDAITPSGTQESTPDDTSGVATDLNRGGRKTRKRRSKSNKKRRRNKPRSRKRNKRRSRRNR